MKKNNVAVDIVSFGSEEQNTEKLEAFHEAVNSGDNSHLVTVPPGMILSDSLFGSPIFQGEGAAGYGGGGDGEAAGGGGGGGTGFEFGIDPSLDPELALALRVSMEEERARLAAAGAASGETSDAVPAAAGQADGQPQSADAPVPMDEDALLQQALAMSMQVDQPEEAAAQPAADTTSTMASAKQDEAMEDMDEELHRALQMSMQDHGDTSTAPAGNMQQVSSLPLVYCQPPGLLCASVCSVQLIATPGHFLYDWSEMAMAVLHMSSCHKLLLMDMAVCRCLEMQML